MSDFEAADGVQPHRNFKSYRLVRKKADSYLWAVLILFAVVFFVCANNFTLLKAYKDLQNQLLSTYQKMTSINAFNSNLSGQKAALDKELAILNEENRKLKEDYEKASRGSIDMTQQLENIKKQNSELAKKNSDLIDENIALQNSLKIAASVGLKPQNYIVSDRLSPRDELNKGKYIGKFLGTAYTPSSEECGNNLGITNSGEPIIPGVTVAVDNKYWPFGTVFYIRGLGFTVAMDTGSAIKGKYRFDFSVLDKKFAQKLGSRKWEVYLVRMGNGDAKNIKL